MSYLKRWRQLRAEATAIALADSSSNSSDNEDTQGQRTPPDIEVPIQNDIQVEPLNSFENQSASDSDTSLNILDCDFEFNDLDESSSDSDSNLEEDQKSTKEKLAEWSCKNNCSRTGINELLDILRGEGLNLPKDARTLLQTPRTVEAIDKCGGKYYYFGIENCIIGALQQVSFEQKNIELFVNIDGIPLFKSSGTQFWPILCSFSSFPPFLVSLYYGDAKPNSLKDYLADFLEEYQNLKEAGITVDGKLYSVTVKAFICDAPARTFLKCIKGHTGYHACERCTIKGYWKLNRIILHAGHSVQKRTDVDFKEGLYTDSHQMGQSPLTQVDINCVSGFCLDYMHLVCLGVVKRILNFLKQGPAQCRLSFHQITEISHNLLLLSGKLPSEFARQPRSLVELDRWKATEFRQFLLYTGPVVLKKVVSKQIYKHFLCLTVAISILLDSNNKKRTAYQDYARQLLACFVNSSKDIYSEIFIVYNVHNLLHLTDDVEYFKTSLNNISSFPFENHLQTIKRLVRNAKNPVAQVAKRLCEQGSCSSRNDIKKDNLNISTKFKNSCFLLSNESYAFVKEKRENGICVCDVIQQCQTDNFFTQPCESKLINIAFVKDFKFARRRYVEKDALCRKVICLPYSRGHVLLPLLHGTEKE